MTSLPRSLRYGKTRVARIRNRVDAVRQAIRKGDIEAAQKAWDDLEQFLPFFMQDNSSDSVELPPNRMNLNEKGETE